MSAALWIEELERRIEAIERKHARIATKPRSHGATKVRATKAGARTRHEGTEGSVLATGLGEIDEALGGGLRAGLHEWYGVNVKVQSSKFKEKTKDKFEIRNSKFENERQRGNEAAREKPRSHEATKPRREETEQPNRQSAIGNRQFVPLCLLVHLAWRALEANPAKWVIWIGKDCFPYPAVLVREAGRDLRLLRRCLFVQARLAADRVWAADLSIRCGLAGAVIADGTGLDMAATRRLQLAAKSRGALVFLARPPQDLDRLSAATTRWMIRNVKFKVQNSKRSHGATRLGGQAAPRSHEERTITLPHYQITTLPNPRWSLELLRCKGMQPTTSRRVWLVEWNRAANIIGVHPAIGDLLVEKPRSHETTRHGGQAAPRRAMG